MNEDVSKETRTFLRKGSEGERKGNKERRIREYGNKQGKKEKGKHKDERKEAKKIRKYLRKELTSLKEGS